MGTPSRTTLPADRPPAKRESAAELRRKSGILGSMPVVQAMLDAMPGGVAILNGCRQIIAANRAFLALADACLENVLGRRLGEVFGCGFAPQGPDGCGTSAQCRNCGALVAIQQSLTAGGDATGECSLTRDRPIKGATLELRLKATATAIGGEVFTVCCLEDITAEKRLGEMSAIFFHDVINAVGGIHGHLDLLAPRIDAGEARSDFQRLRWLVDQLADEIEAQRDLTLAQSGDLVVEPQVVRTGALLDDLRQTYVHHPAGWSRYVEVSDPCNAILVTDIRLLSRVLGNMLRNALEATPPGGTVILRCAAQGEQIAFHVHNPGAIPEAVQEQLFKRRVSTRGGTNRGVGTRSMKLLGETYLQGAVSFTSSAAEGTTFTIVLPRVLTRFAAGDPEPAA